MAIEGYSLSTLNQFVGQEIGVSEWITVDQARINQFADSTGDQEESSGNERCQRV